MRHTTLDLLRGHKWISVSGRALHIGGGMFRLRARVPGRKSAVTIDWIVGREAEWNVRNVVFA